MENLSSLLTSGTIATLRSYMIAHFPYVVIRDDMKLQELKNLAKKWDQIARDSRKRTADDRITSDDASDGTSAVTSSNIDTTQAPLKKQKLAAPPKTPRFSKEPTTRPRNSSRVAKELASRRRSKTSKITRPSVTQPINIKIEETPERTQMPAKSKPSRKSKPIVKYSSSLTTLSDDEDRLEFRKTKQSKQPLTEPNTSDTTLVNMDEIEDLLFNPSYQPTITSNEPDPCESIPEKLIDAPDFVEDEVNLMYLGEVDHFQDEDEKEANLQVPLVSSEARSCKSECHEEILLLKARVKKLEDLVFAQYHAVPSCCAGIPSGSS